MYNKLLPIGLSLFSAITIHSTVMVINNGTNTFHAPSFTIDLMSCDLTPSFDCPTGEFCECCEVGSSSLYLPRPQGLNSAVFYNPYYYGCETCCSGRSFNLNVGYRYQETFRDSRIAKCLFGASNLFFSGSLAPKPFFGDILADNFGLSPHFVGRLQLHPSIQNQIIDVDGWWEMGSWCEQLDRAWLAFNASVVQTRWDLNACAFVETTSAQNQSSYPPCYMSKNAARATLDFQTALGGQFTFGDMQNEWNFGRFVLDESQRTTGLANIDVLLGYDFARCPTAHVGAFVKMSAPTGTRPDAQTVFQPIVGNGHHWEFGGGVNAHLDIWNCDDHCVYIGLNGCITHLFNDTQFRSFDLVNPEECMIPGTPGILSRYVLLKEFSEDCEYTGNLVNGINVLTRKIKSSFNVQGDAALRFVYRVCNWAMGVGYNVYGRSTESVKLVDDDCQPDLCNFGIKGNSGVCARAWKSVQGVLCSQCPDGRCQKPVTRRLNATESKARIFNTDELSDLVDNPTILTGTDDIKFIAWNSPACCDTPEDQLILAVDSQKDGEPAPVLLSPFDVNFCGVPSQLSHKLFGFVDYQWEDCEWQPYVGAGGEVEFAANGKCKVCTASFWSVYFRAGLQF